MGGIYYGSQLVRNAEELGGGQESQRGTSQGEARGVEVWTWASQNLWLAWMEWELGRDDGNPGHRMERLGKEVWGREQSGLPPC